jgi:S-DNA-T family DNA segregation ATPase FtsK/SpoIIIE
MIENNYRTKDANKKSRLLPSFSLDRKLRIGVGLFIQSLALFIFIAMVAHLLYAKYDQPLVDSISTLGLRKAGASVKNWLGIVGALVSYYLIFRWLGIAAFMIICPIYLIGHRITYQKRFANISIVKNIAISIIFILWISLALGYLHLLLPIVGSGIINLVGGVGLELALLFQDLFGVGTILILLALLPIVLIYTFDLEKVIDFFFKKKNNEINDNPDVYTSDEANLRDLSINNDRHTRYDNKKAEELDLQIIPTIQPRPQVDDLHNITTVFIQDEGLKDYIFPESGLLNEYNQEEISVSKAELEQNKKKIVETLINFHIGVSSIYATIGPTVTLYEIIPDAGVKISRIKNLEDDIALSLAALGIRIIAPIPGKGTIGIEVPNKNKQIVPLRTIINSEKFKNTPMSLPIVMGKTIDNEACIVDLATMPHLLIAGATGQGKSVGLNVVLTSLIYRKHPSQLKLVLVDPKKVELSLYSKLEKHFLAKLPGTDEPIITETKKVIHTLKSLCCEMDQRYELLKDAGVRNIKEYNAKYNNNLLNGMANHRFLPYIVLVIDEFADLMMVAGKEIEMPIARLAQLARAIGIHLVLATQRPSVNIITGIIKANFPARVSYKVSSKVDSRTILDTSGAEQLVGRGDFLLSMNSDVIRIQCPFLDTDEVERICSFVGEQQGYNEPYLLPECSVDDDDNGGAREDISLADRDPLFEEAAQLIVTSQQGSTSLIQRRMKLGYNRAGRIMDQLELAGIVGPADGSKPREVLLHDAASLEVIFRELNGA